MRALFKRLYGAGPEHLAIHLVGLAIGAFALDRIIAGGAWINFVAFFVGAALLHDLVLLPIYATLDRVGFLTIDRQARPHLAVPLINHLRAPALISGVLLLIYLPLISGKSDASLRAASGHQPHGYLRNWLLITAALFLISGAVYALRTWRAQPASG